MKYKISYIGFAYVEADSEEEAKEKAGIDDVIYAEHEWTKIEEVNEFEVIL